MPAWHDIDNLKPEIRMSKSETREGGGRRFSAPYVGHDKPRPQRFA